MHSTAASFMYGMRKTLKRTCYLFHQSDPDGQILGRSKSAFRFPYKDSFGFRISLRLIFCCWAAS